MSGILKDLIFLLILVTMVTCIIYNLKIINLNKKDLCILTFVNFFIYVFCFYNFQVYLLPISSIYIVIFLLFKHISVFSAIIITLLTNLISAISDVIAGTIIINIFKINYEVIQSDGLIEAILHILVFVVGYIISKSSAKLFGCYNKMITKKINKRDIILILLVLISLIFLYINTILFKRMSNEVNSKKSLLIFTLTIGYVLMEIFLVFIYGKFISKEIDDNYNKKSYNQLKEYIYSLEKLSNNLKKYKHDFNNIILTLDEFIKKNDMRGLSEYYYEILRKNWGVINSNNDTSFLQLSNVEITGLKGIISSKLIYAQSLGINIKIEIPEKINQLMIETIDLCRIIGILLDNSIEANLEVDNKQLYLYILKKDDYLKIIILNSCNNINFNIHEIYKEGFSMKGENRGIGLNIVQDILRKKYPNVFLNTKIENGSFKQEIIVHNKR